MNVRRRNLKMLYAPNRLSKRILPQIPMLTAIIPKPSARQAVRIALQLVENYKHDDSILTSDSLSTDDIDDIEDEDSVDVIVLSDTEGDDNGNSRYNPICI